MTIRTRFNIGDEVKVQVFLLGESGTSIQVGTITHIIISMSKDKIQKKYSVTYLYQGTVRYADVWEADLVNMQKYKEVSEYDR